MENAEILRTAESGNGHVLRIHVDPRDQDAWRRNAYEMARQRLSQAHPEGDLLFDVRECPQEGARG